MKYRDKLCFLMAGPILFMRISIFETGGLQRVARTQNLSFGVSSHPLMWQLIDAGALRHQGAGFLCEYLYVKTKQAPKRIWRLFRKVICKV